MCLPLLPHTQARCVWEALLYVLSGGKGAPRSVRQALEQLVRGRLELHHFNSMGDEEADKLVVDSGKSSDLLCSFLMTWSRHFKGAGAGCSGQGKGHRVPPSPSFVCVLQPEPGEKMLGQVTAV